MLYLCSMIGLREYIGKYGKHFTVELAYKVVGNRWNAKKIYDYIQKKVYYNVSGTTLGDMVYLFNSIYVDLPDTKSYCREKAIEYIQDMENLDACPIFDIWSRVNGGEDIDLREYIE